MQELMSRHKAYALSPRDCLKTTLFQKWQRMIAPTSGKRGIFYFKNKQNFLNYFCIRFDFFTIFDIFFVEHILIYTNSHTITYDHNLET